VSIRRILPKQMVEASHPIPERKKERKNAAAFSKNTTVSPS
jgi:hypothetical protein